MPPLGESQRVPVRILHVELAGSPGLVDRSFMNVLWRVRISRGDQASFPKLAKECIDIVRRDGDCLAERPVPAMTGEDELAPITREDAKGGIANVVIAVHMVEIKHTGVERERLPHAPAANGRNDCHAVSWHNFWKYPRELQASGPRCRLTDRA